MLNQRIAGLAALGSAALVLLTLLVDAFISSNEGRSEFLLVGAPFLFVPAVLFMVKDVVGWKNFVPKFAAWASLVAFAIVAMLSYLPEGAYIIGASPETIAPHLMWLVSGMGLSLVLGNGVVMERTGTTGLNVLGIIAGISWMLPLWASILTSTNPGWAAGSGFSLLFNLAAPVWLISHLVYGVWLSTRLLSRRGGVASTPGPATS